MTEPAIDLSDFLSRLGLSQLLDRFEAEDIDMSVLPLMDKDDLKELGLTLGQRKKMLAGLDALKGKASTNPSSAVEAMDQPIQLRRLSVMFCDMVGSTQLGEKLNIDEMQSLLQHYYDVAHDTAQQHQGRVVGTQGDGVIILFGYPSVLEGFAERCVEAAQALQLALVEKSVSFDGKDPIRIATRIGIATGQAAVGQGESTLLGEQLRLVGPVVNRAARLQTVAHPQSIAVDLKTQELTNTAVRYSDVEQHDLKGLPSGVEVFHVMGLQNTSVSLNAPVKLIGRDPETTTLHDLWTQAQTGEPSMATVLGEAGIGKSTLVQSFVATHTAPRTRVLQLHCTAMAAKSPLRPVAKALKSLMSDSGEIVTLSNLLRDPDPEILQLTAQFLGLGSAGSSDAAVSMKDRERILDLLSHWIARGPDGPTLLILENAQWADDSTRELLQRGARSANTDGAPLLMLATARDETGKIWSDETSHKTLSLLPLSAYHSSELLQSIFSGKPVPQTVRENILDHSGGNPLMLETLGAADAERQVDQINEVVEVPYTIYESVSKRLDGIRSGRSIIEALAVLNNPASHELIAAVMERDEKDMTPAVDALEQAGLIVRDMSKIGEVLRIKHTVYRDVIYEQIVGKSRTLLHSAAYSALNTFDPSIQATRPDVLALHAHAAGNWDHTSIHALNAGETLLERSALIEAGYFLEMADAALEKLPNSVAVQQMRLRAITGLASVERSRFGIATDTSAALGQKAVQLARELGDSKTELLALNGLYAHALVRADYPLAEDYAHALLNTAEKSQNKTFVMIGTRAIGAVAFHRSDYKTAIANLGSALAQYDKDEHLPLAHAHGYDHAEICAAFLSMSYWLTGDLLQARHYSTFSIEHSREIGHVHSLAQAMAFRVLLGGLARESSELNAIGAEAAELGEKFGIQVMRAAGLLFPLATRLCLQPTPPTPNDMTMLDEYLQEFRAVNPFNYGPLVATLLADVYLRVGDLDAAEEALSQGTKAERYTGETWTSPELLRMRARVADERGDASAATALRNDALMRATDAGAKTLALRTVCDMADIVPTATQVQAVQEAILKMGSDDNGWDMQRANALVQLARRA